MKRCGVKPYEGNEKYIFISYCHKDKAIVFPIIEQLARDGYRLWYDEGIDPGSEWPEIIASHLNGCYVCIAFISNQSLDSHNCRREVNFALLKKKNFISIVIEPVKMTPGMEMQLSDSQAIYKYKLPSDFEFFTKLYSADFLKGCKGEPDLSIIVSDSRDYLSYKEPVIERDSFSDKWFTDTSTDDISDSAEVVEDASADSTSENIESNQKNIPVKPQQDHIETEWISEHKTSVKEDKKEVPEVKKIKKFYIIRNKTGEKIALQSEKTVLGRSETKTDYQITGNSTIGRVHAYIIIHDENCNIVDCNSKNKTKINKKILDPEKEYPLSDGDVFQLANELFTFKEVQE